MPHCANDACALSFVATRSGQLYCCNACRQKAYRERRPAHLRRRRNPTGRCDDCGCFVRRGYGELIICGNCGNVYRP